MKLACSNSNVKTIFCILYFFIHRFKSFRAALCVYAVDYDKTSFLEKKNALLHKTFAGETDPSFNKGYIQIFFTEKTVYVVRNSCTAYF